MTGCALEGGTQSEGDASAGNNRQAPSNETARLLQTLHAWSDAGWIRHLDSAFADFLVDLCPQASAPVVLAAALVAHMEGRGHICLLIDDLLREPEELLGWTSAASEQLRAVMAGLPAGADDWLAALHASPLVWVDTSTPLCAMATESRCVNEPLILRGSKLYLRRYWTYEQRVAAQILLRGTTSIAVDQDLARQWLGRLFPVMLSREDKARDASDSPGPGGRIDWQKLACAMALRGTE